MAIELWADTAAHDEIDYCFSRGADQGITTNPLILMNTGDMSVGFEGACKGVLERWPNVPVSLETDLRGLDVAKLRTVPPETVRDVILEQAYQLAAWGKNVVVKIPFCEGGLMATRELSKKGIKTNVTATMDSGQVLMARDAGAYVTNIFVNRRLDLEVLRLAGEDPTVVLKDPNWKDLVAKHRPRYNEQAWEIVLEDMAYAARELDGSKTRLIGASIRAPSDIYRIAKTGPQIITIPTKIVKGLEGDLGQIKSTRREVRSDRPVRTMDPYNNPITIRTLLDFEEAADSYRKT